MREVREEYTFEKVVDNLKNNNIDAIAIAYSAFHTIGINAFLRDTSKKIGRKLKVIIVINPHSRELLEDPKERYVIDENNFCKEFADFKFYYNIYQSRKSAISNVYRLFKDNILTLLGLFNIKSDRKNRELFIISPQNPNLDFIKFFSVKEVSSNFSPTFIIVDEGIGTYFSKKYWKIYNQYKLYAKYSALEKIIMRLNKKKEDFVKKILFKKVSIQYKLILKENHQINWKVVSSYRKIIQWKKKSKRIKDPIVLIVTAPYSESRKISQKEELLILDELISFLDKKGYKFILKPHPRENLDKYTDLIEKFKGLELINQKLPAEELIVDLSPKYIIGYTSSILLYAKIFWDLKSVSIVNLFTKNSDNEYLKITVEEFKELCRKYVQFVDNIEDLNQILKD